MYERVYSIQKANHLYNEIIYTYIKKTGRCYPVSRNY